jgi:predicted Rossmann-fold nucleotide-binding protein
MGFGTMNEIMEVLTLIQTKKVDRPVPMVLYGPHFWNYLMNLDKLAEWGVISQSESDLFEFIDIPEEAFAYLSDQFETHSSG